MRHVFESTWVFIGLESQVRNPHDYVTTFIGRQPVVLSRGADGALGWSRAYPPDLAAGTYHGTAACGEADGDSYTTSVDSAVIRLPPLEHTHTWLLEDPLLISIWNVKYDAAGTLLWEVEWGDPYNDIAVACAIDSAGRLLVAGAVYDATGATIHPLVLRYEGL